MKKIVITLDVNGDNHEAHFRIPNIIAERMGFDELKAGVEQMFFPVEGIDVIQIEMVEEVRHQMRRWDDKPFVNQ